jgi:hypothetical protein
MISEFRNTSKNSELTLTFSAEVWCRDSLPQIAGLKNYLKTATNSTPIDTITVNFSATHWVEVPTLLALSTLLAENSKTTSIRVIFDAQSATNQVYEHAPSQGIARRRKFLSFLRSMGFFSALPPTAQIIDSNCHSESATETEIETSLTPKAYEEKLATNSAQPFIQAITLIPLTIAHTTQFQANERQPFNDKKLKETLRTISDNAALNISAFGIGKGTIERQRILLSLDKILLECIANIVEHAYKDEPNGGYFALFARIRNPNSTFANEFSRGLYDSSDEYDHSKDINWTELYISDLGVGIESQLAAWLTAEEQKKEKDKNLLAELRNAIRSQNPFLHSSRLMFDHSLSRHANRNMSRSPQTGLQDLKRVLTDVGYVDVTNCLEVNRRRFVIRRGGVPQTARTAYNEAKTLSLITEDQSKSILANLPPTPIPLKITAGTHLIFRTQFGAQLPSKLPSGYRNIGFKAATKCLDAYQRTTPLPPTTISIDKRFAATTRPSETDYQYIDQAIEKSRTQSSLTIFVRLSRNPYKNDVNDWIKIFNQSPEGRSLQRKVYKKAQSVSIYFVDVLPIYAGWLLERIRSFANSKWLLESEFASVGILTTLLHSAVFERSSDTFKVVNPKKGNHADRIQLAVQSLREMDTSAFWADYDGNPLTEAYLDADVEWLVSRRRLGDVFRHEERVIRGFLDFPAALQSVERYRVCERALLRFMSIVYNLNPNIGATTSTDTRHFIPQLRSSDSMTQRLANSVNGLFNEVASIDDSSALVLSSIIVTGQTQDRASATVLDAQTEWDPIRATFFDRSRETGQPLDTYAMMRWVPPVSSTSTPYARQRRIFRTTEVSQHGALDIRIPHVSSRPGSRAAGYHRDRSETYSDFANFGSLEIGHFRKSNRHELINVNFTTLLPLLISSSHMSWTWLISQFFDIERDKDKLIVVVYPNQPHAELIVQEVRHREAAKVPTSHVLKSRKTEPILVSPRLSTRILDLIREKQGKVSSQGSSRSREVVIRLFDAGVVSGRTFRALEQYILKGFAEQPEILTGSLAKPTIETISLLDRSGTPIYGELLESYFQSNRRFWRWDVPSLTDNGICRVCLAQQRAREHFMRHRRASDVQKLDEIPALAAILEQPHQTDAGGMLGTNDLSDIDVSLLPIDAQQVIFGYDGREPNRVPLTSAMQYVSIFAELTRLLQRSDITLNRAMEISQDKRSRSGNLDALVVILLATHLLLFYETFDRFETVNYAAELFGCLVDFHAGGEQGGTRAIANALGVLALYSIDADTLEILKGKSFFCHWLTVKHLSNADLADFIKNISLTDIPFPLQNDVGAKTSDAWRANQRFLRRSPAAVVSSLMDIIGDQRIWHKSYIAQRLAPSSASHRLMQPDLQKILALTKEARDLAIFNASSDVTRVLERHAENQSDDPFLPTERTELFDVLNEGKECLRTSLFSQLIYFGPPDPNSPAWSDQRLVLQLLRLALPDQGDQFSAFIEQLNRAIKNNSNSMTVGKLMDYVGISLQPSGLPFESAVSLAPSEAVRTVIENTLLNSRHAPRAIQDPTGSDKGAQLRFVWVWLAREGDRVVLTFYNACDRKPLGLDSYTSRFPDFIAEGHRIEIDFDSKRRLLQTRIVFNELVRRHT